MVQVTESATRDGDSNDVLSRDIARKIARKDYGSLEMPACPVNPAMAESDQQILEAWKEKDPKVRAGDAAS